MRFEGDYLVTTRHTIRQLIFSNGEEVVLLMHCCLQMISFFS